MADEDRDQDGPSLELPSFGFGRKRRKQEVEPAGPAADETQPMPAARTESSPEPEAARPTPAEPESAPAPAPEPAPVPAPAPVPEAPATPPLFVDETTPPTSPASTRTPEPRPSSVAAPSPTLDDDNPPAKHRPRLPSLDGRAAAVVTGLVIGVLSVGLTWASLGLCDAVKGTSSCGNSGYLLLVAILIAMVLLGSVLLRAWDIPDATSISFLAVGLLAVFVLVFLVGALESWTMILVIPLVTAAAYALSHWVTTSITEDSAD